jgi:glycosyltransferase involved in cell wall biosynthesis
MIFSIVIPLYNKAEYVSKTLQSVLEQTYPDFEVIIVDDGSKDNGLEVVKQFTDRRIKIIHQENKGVSAARNTGIKAAQYELIALLDADDWWDREYLQEMVGLINEYPDVSIYGTQFTRIINEKVQLPEILLNNKEKYVKFDLIDVSHKKARLPIHTSSVIIKKEMIEKVGYFDEKIYMFEDYDLFIRIALCSKVAFLNKKPLSFYNLDVSAETKARGHIPMLSKNWVSHMIKFAPFLPGNKKLLMLLTTAKLKQILFYRQHSDYKQQVKDLIKEINRTHINYKYRIALALPFKLYNVLLSIYLYIHKK